MMVMVGSNSWPRIWSTITSPTGITVGLGCANSHDSAGHGGSRGPNSRMSSLSKTRSGCGPPSSSPFDKHGILRVVFRKKTVLNFVAGCNAVAKVVGPFFKINVLCTRKKGRDEIKNICQMKHVKKEMEIFFCGFARLKAFVYVMRGGTYFFHVMKAMKKVKLFLLDTHKHFFSSGALFLTSRCTGNKSALVKPRKKSDDNDKHKMYAWHLPGLEKKSIFGSERATKIKKCSNAPCLYELWWYYLANGYFLGNYLKVHVNKSFLGNAREFFGQHGWINSSKLSFRVVFRLWSNGLDRKGKWDFPGFRWLDCFGCLITLKIKKEIK